MSFFTFDIKKLVVIISFILIPLISINMQHKIAEKPAFVRPFTFVAGLIQNAYSSFSSGVRGTTNLYLNLIDIKKNNRLLSKEISELRAKFGSMTELKLENERLNKLLGFKQKTNMNLLTAKVIGKDLIPDHNTITIDRGTKHGLRASMAAITIGGVVGYVIEPQLFTSQILLLTDRYTSIDALVQRSRARGIVEGINKSECQLNYLQRQDDVKVGDLIVTSGLDNIFPKGFPVGLVTSVEKNQYDISQEVRIQPAVNPFTLEEIFIVLNANEENFESSDKFNAESHPSEAAPTNQKNPGET